MKIVIAPDSFKESISAGEAAAVIAEGVLEVCPDAVLDLCPMADGGEGTVAAMVDATGGQWMTADVFDPLGSEIRARFGILGSREGTALPGELGLSAAMSEQVGEPKTAVIEMAAASGLTLVPPDRRDPTRTTTFGTGQLILEALDAGARQILLGIGGSATCDAGCGCAQALGATFLDRAGGLCVCGLSGGGLADIAGIDLSDMDPRLAETRIRVACDVTNPLTGPEGAAFVYGPQKGASAEQAALLDANLRHLAAVVRDQLGKDIESLPGAGAAGGLGAGLAAFAGAALEPGVDLLAEAVGLFRRLRGADLCITGEGKLDASSAFGKTAVSVARAARRRDAPTLCLCGQVEDGAPRDAFLAVRELTEGRISAREAMLRAAELLRLRASEAMREVLAAGR